jgi:hypothetical protein
MGQFHDFVSTTLSDGRITESEVPLIEAEIWRNGRLDIEDVKLLVELYCHAREYCPSFEQLFFQVLEQVILQDGEIQPSEQYYLLRMIYSDRVVRDVEKQFLAKIRGRVSSIDPGFAELCDEVMLAESGVSSVGDGMA